MANGHNYNTRAAYMLTSSQNEHRQPRRWKHWKKSGAHMAMSVTAILGIIIIMSATRANNNNHNWRADGFEDSTTCVVCVGGRLPCPTIVTGQQLVPTVRYPLAAGIFICQLARTDAEERDILKHIFFVLTIIYIDIKMQYL